MAKTTTNKTYSESRTHDYWLGIPLDAAVLTLAHCILCRTCLFAKCDGTAPNGRPRTEDAAAADEFTKTIHTTSSVIPRSANSLWSTPKYALYHNQLLNVGNSPRVKDFMCTYLFPAACFNAATRLKQQTHLDAIKEKEWTTTEPQIIQLM